MASTFWQAELADIEPTRFPDLTGKSTAAHGSHPDYQSAERVFGLDGNVFTVRKRLTFLAACFKIAALYTGERDICLDYLEHPIQSLQEEPLEENPLPLRIPIETSVSNDDVVSQIDYKLTEAQRQATEKLYNAIKANAAYQYDLIVGQIVQQDSPRETCTVQLHFRSSILLSNDTHHVFAALEEALNSVQYDPKSKFLAWNSKPNIRPSISNWDFKPAKSSNKQVVQAAFEAHAKTRPNDIALDYIAEDQTRTTWTYAILDSVSNLIANKLIENFNIHIEDSVPICLAKSPAFYACVLGILKAGANFTPFAGSPPERLKYMLEELDSKVLLYTQGQDMAWCGETKTLDVTPIIEEGLRSGPAQTLAVRPDVMPSNLCYQMYTSGSTGRPKAVSLEHQNAVQTACSVLGLIPWKSDSRILQQAGVTFDMCYFETFFAWTAGICLCSAPDSLIYNRLADVINVMNVSLLGLTPSVALTLNPYKVPGIKWMYCIGEALPQSLVDAWEGRLVNSYGPTEAAQMVTLFPVDRNIKSTVIGSPFGNTSFVVTQMNSTETLPILGIGELCIGGHQVARGYYKNEQRTQSSFVILNEQRFYRTGDLVRMLSSGNFEFIGRADDQVKVRGQRVELGEIDRAAESSHSAIDRACTHVLKVNDKSKGQLVTFIVLTSDFDEQHQQEVRLSVEAYLSDSLPAYMVPKLFLFIDRIPLSPAGKVNKRALTQILRDSDQVKSSVAQSVTDASLEMSNMLKQTYSVFSGIPADKIGVDVSIYQLGIDSINAIQIAHALSGKGFRIQASDVMNHPTITQLSSFLQDASRPDGFHDIEDGLVFDFEAFDRKNRQGVLQKYNLQGSKVAFIRPASPLQSSMVAQSLRSSGVFYFNHITYRLPSKLDIVRFYDAWEALVSKHEILRSGFVHIDDREHPIAMVTYYARSVSLPIQQVNDEDSELDRQRSDFAQLAIQQVHIPPWQVMISPKRDRFHLSAHHALYDAQVLEILIRDLALAYDGLRLPGSQDYEPHLVQFLQRTDAQRQTSFSFWEDYGKDMGASKFPVMTPLLEESTEISVTSMISPSPLLELERGCRTSGITMQAAAQVAWGYLLGALTGEETVTFGTILSGRVKEFSAEVSFPTITTVPTIVRNRVPYSKAIVHELMKFNADVQQHQFLPLKQMQALMGFSGRMQFDTLFTFQKRSHRQITTKTRFEFIENKLVIDYPVSVELEPVEPGHLGFTIFYQRNIMCPDQARLLAKQFHSTLRSIIFQHDEQLTPVMAHADPRLFSITPPVHASLQSNHSLLHHAVELTAILQPQKIALEYVTNLDNQRPPTLCWTFQQLNQKGNRVAHLLHKRGVRQGSIVAMCFDKCPEASFAMLGIAKAGCGFLALDPEAPVERKRFIMEDSQASVLLSKGSLAETLRSVFTDTVINLSDEDLDKCSGLDIELSKPIDPQETAYCLYTSGTTGTPKGCLVTHENVVQVLMCFEKLYKYTDRSRWLQFASYHFDVSVMEHFWSWFVGITVVTATRDLILQDLSGTISTLQITHIDLTPSLARLLGPEEVPTLASGVFVTGGEMLRRDIIEAWGSSGAIHNAYGPTEATIGVTMYRNVPKNGRPSNIGWPFDVVGIIVSHPTNPNLPVLRGGIGELLITGKLVAKGYLRRDTLTEQRFIHVNGHKCYRTGDLVRVLANGSIEFLGRADDQVKLRGQRLEIGEINVVIKQRNAQIDDVCTLVLKHHKQQAEQLVSFVSVHGIGNRMDELSLCVDETNLDLVLNLRTACVERLPGYMIPTHILLINKMPLSTNNKVEAKRLKELYDMMDMNRLQTLMENERMKNFEQIEDSNVKQIRDILSRLVGIDRAEVQPASTLFELGLDSVSIISFSRALREAGYPRANPSLIMRNLTISRLVTAIVDESSYAVDGSVQSAMQKMSAFNLRHADQVRSILGLKSDNIEIIVPCTALQAGMISRSLESNHGLYFSAFSLDIHDSVNLDKLRQACQLVCDHVQMLRTRFVPTDDGYVQAILRDVQVPWIDHEVDTEDHLDNALKIGHRRWWEQNQHDIERPFELVLTRSPTQVVLSLHIFHALYDGNSLPLMMNALVGEYRGNYRVDYGPPFSDSLPYGPLREVDGSESFWIDHLSGLGHTPLATIKPLSTANSLFDTCVEHRISPIKELETCRRRLNVTHQAIIQACWAVVLQDVMSGPMILGIIVSGRTIDFDGSDKVIGPLFNTLPFLLRLRQEDTWGTVIIRSHNFNSGALAYQHTPLRDIQKWTRKIGVSSALFDTLFVFQKQNQHDRLEPLWTARDETFEADYPLAFEVEQTIDGGFNLTLACQSHVSDERSSRLLLEKFEHTLKSMITNVDQQLTKIVNNQIFVEEQKDIISGAATPNNITNNLRSEGQNGDNTPNFSETALKIRDEIASLAGVSADEIYATTSIFEVGLDSIDAVKLSSRLRQSVGVQIPVSQIMKLLTLDRIAHAAKQGKPVAYQSVGTFDLDHTSDMIEQSLKASGLELPGAERILPCTPLQEAMVADMVNSDFERYLNFDVLKLNEDTDVEKLKEAWTRIFEACPILRTRFVDIDDPEIDYTIAQVVMPTTTIDFAEIVIDTEDDISQVLSNIRKEVKRTFDERPASRLTLVRSRGQTTTEYLILALPHAMYDGWSLDVIHDSVGKVYHGDGLVAAGNESALTNILSSSAQASSEFWRQTLDGARATLLPRQEHGVAITYRTQWKSTVSLDVVRTFCKQSKVTIGALCQTIWAVVLAHRTQQLDVCFAQVLSGRTDESTHGVVFPTMNTIISRAIIHGTRSEMAEYVQRAITTISQYQHFPLRKAISFASENITGDIFNTLFIFQKSNEDEDNDRKRLYESVESLSRVEYPVCVEAEVSHAKLIWRAACEDSHLSRSAVETLLDDLDRVLCDFVANPNEPVVKFSRDQMQLCSLSPVKMLMHQKLATDKMEPRLTPSHGEQWTVNEQLVRQAVASVAKLDHGEVSRQSNLLSLGLDSISTIKVSSLLRKQGLKLSVNEILNASSIEGIAKMADRDGSDGHTSLQHTSKEDAPTRMQSSLFQDADVDVHELLVENSIPSNTVEEVLPITPGQVLLLSRWQNEGVYYSSLDFSALGCNDVTRLQSAWSTLVSRTAMLRTIFVGTGRRQTPVMQVTLKAVEPRFEVVPPDSSLHKRANESMEACSSSMSAPCALFAKKTTGNQFELILKFCHALYDGFSIKMLISAFSDLTNNGSLPIAAQSLSFRDYLDTIGSIDSRRQFWSNYLSDMKFYPLPTLTTEVEGPARQLHIVNTDLLRDLHSLRAFARKNHVSIQSLLLASYAKTHASMLHECTSKDSSIDDVLIGVFMANRNIEGAEELTAPTLSFTPVRVKQPLARPLIEMAQGIQTDMMEISEHGRSQVGIWELQDWISSDIKVDVWVNLLRQWRPDASEEEEGAATNTTGVVQIVTGEKSEQFEREYAIDRFDEDRSNGLLLRNNAVRTCYDYPMLDLEATVKDDNVDIGVQGSTKLLSVERARWIVQDVSTRLNELTMTTK